MQYSLVLKDKLNIIIMVMESEGAGGRREACGLEGWEASKLY